MFKPAPDANVQVVEPEHIRDDYVTDFAPIEAVGPCARFTMVVESTMPGSGKELLVVRKMMVPIERLPEMIERTSAFLRSYYADQMRLASGTAVN